MHLFNIYLLFCFVLSFFPHFVYSQLKLTVGRHGRVGHHVMAIVIVPVRGIATIPATCNLVVEM